MRNGLIGAALALVFLVGGSGTAGAHTSPGSSVAGAAGWLDHAGVVGDGVYSYVVADTNTSDGKCAILQVSWGGQPWYTEDYTCNSTPGTGTFSAPAGGVFFQVCAFSVADTDCGPVRGYWDNGH